jgi:hypothetical protein
VLLGRLRYPNEMSPLTIIALGFLLGIRHATDPDHVVAVSAMVSRERSAKRAALLGLSWGLGHALTVLVVGAGMIAFDVTLPARLGLGLELAVAVMLIVLGTMNVCASRRSTRANDHHTSGSTPPPPDPASRSFLRSLAIGVVHGLAGSAAIALVVVASIPETGWALVYLALFGLGTMGGMIAITVALALPFLASKVAARLQARVVWLTGVASILVGFGVAYQIIVMDGWLSAAPNWSPR